MSTEFLKDLMPELAEIQARAELLEIASRIHAAQLAAHPAIGVFPETSVRQARALIEAVNGSIEAEGLPGFDVEEDEDDDVEEDDDDDEPDDDDDDDDDWSNFGEGDDDWVGCTETAGCSMRHGHDGGCFVYKVARAFAAATLTETKVDDNPW